MKKVIFYSYPKCLTCRKALKWLYQNKVIYQLIDIVKETPSKKFLELALIHFSLDKKKLFKTIDKDFKSIDFFILDLPKKKIFKLLSNKGKLIKRPFLITIESQLILCFNESEYAASFK